MEIKPRIIRDYVTPDGHEPFEEWLDSLRDKKTHHRGTEDTEKARRLESWKTRK